MPYTYLVTVIIWVNTLTKKPPNKPVNILNTTNTGMMDTSAAILGRIK